MQLEFANTLLKWYDKNGRKSLPWRKDITPYRVWLSEIMLQQTQVKTVVPYFHKFLQNFPTIKNLAQAKSDQVLFLWSGLGYYARARNLHQCAKIIVNEFAGKFPNDFTTLMQLPGIGRSTAGAILAIAFKKSYPILDGNVKRILTRLFAIKAWPGQTAIEKNLWQYATNLLPKNRLDDYTQAQMDLGATICVRRKPLCGECPVNQYCQAYAKQVTDIIPAKKPRKSLVEKQTNLLILVDENNGLLLEKRPDFGIWGGLWSLPENQDISKINHVIKERFACELIKISLLPAFTHTFTHFKLLISPYLIRVKIAVNQVMDNMSLQWYHFNECKKLGLPTPIKNLLQRLELTL
ncbi:MAG: A/G-specific adenine glycosylase [Pseudomonadota bacterium]